MHEIIFYTNKKGISPIQEYLNELSRKKHKSKEYKIKFTKIIAYIDLLAEKGTTLGGPYIKHLEDDIWELRPLRDRIFFAYLDNNKIILLHYFMKKTQKTPKEEIEKAKNYLKEYIDRGD